MARRSVCFRPAAHSDTHQAMRRPTRIKRPWVLLAAALFGAAFASGCSSCRKPSGEASPAASSSATTASDRPKLPAPTRQGSVIAHAADNTILYVADEDAGVLHLVPLPFGKDNPARAVTLPGRPAQVLPLDGEVLVTIREPGLLLVMRPDAAAGLVEA